MANIKVSEMPLATSVAPEDLIMLIQGGGNKRVTTNTLLGDNVIVSPTEPVGNDRKKVWFRWSNNLFDKDNTLDGYEINGDTGEVKVRSDYFVSDYIKVSPNDKVFLSGKSVGRSNCFYDRNKKYIDKVTLNSGLITVPNNSSICYLRFNGLLTEKDNIMLEYGTSRTEYQPYVEPQIFIKNANGVYEEFITNNVISGQVTAITDNAGRILVPIPLGATGANVISVEGDYFTFLRPLQSNKTNSLCYLKDPDNMKAIANTSVTVVWSYIK